MESLKALTKAVKLTKREKVEMAMIALTGVILTCLFFYVYTPAYAAISEQDMADIVKTIVKVICYIVGALFIIVGAVKFAISHANEDGPAQQKAIMMMATGVLLVVLATLLVNMIKADWFKVS